MKKHILLGTSVLALMLTNIPSGYADDGTTDLKLKITTGADYSSGKYGASESTDILYAPVTVKGTYGDFTTKLTVPYLTIKGPGSVVGGGDGSISQGNGSSAVTTERGLGDVVASLTYTQNIDSAQAYIDYTAKIKFPTADEKKGLGTGETDYTAYVEGTKVIGDAYLFLGTGYKVLGDSSTLQLDNVWYTSTGGGYKITPDTTLGLSYDYKEAASSTGSITSEVTGSVTQKLSPTLDLQFYGITGFSDGSPDAGGGVMLGYKM